MVKHGWIIDFDLDLKKRSWSKIGHIEAGNFPNYTTKQGYKIIIPKQAQTHLFQPLWPIGNTLLLNAASFTKTYGTHGSQKKHLQCSGYHAKEGFRLQHGKLG